MKKIGKWLATAFLGSLLSLSGCSYSPEVGDTATPRDAFAFMQIDASPIVLQICDEKTKTCEFGTTELHSRGSGIVVANSKVYSNRQYVMTAGHVCESDKWFERRVRYKAKRDGKIIPNIVYSPRMTVMNNSGQTYNAKVVAVWPKHDICLVAVSHMGVRPVQLARKQVKKGSKIWNLAAPLGIWQPDLQNKFTGYYSGTYTCTEEEKDTFAVSCVPGERSWSVFTLPATHGSSGSPLFNSSGQVIGIISMVPEGFPEVAYAVRLEDMKYLVERMMGHERAQKHKHAKDDIDYNLPGLRIDDVLVLD